MKKVEYRCNLCFEIKPKNELKAFYYDSTIKTKDTFGAYTLIDNIDSCDKHICINCIDIIKDSKTEEDDKNKY